MKSKMLFAALALSVMVGSASAYLAWSKSTADIPGMAKQSGPDPRASAAIIAKQENQDPTRLVMELAVYYLEHYGETITEPATQARLYNERRALLERYPSTGNELFKDAVTTAFPELAGQILTLIANLDRYHDWLDDHEFRLQGLPALERSAEVWQQREAIFGTLASEIWADEQNAVEEQSAVFQQELARLDQSEELQLTELAYQLQSTADELYGNNLTRQFVSSGALGHALFSLDSVQSQLASMPADQRQQTIDGLRQQLGYSGDAIERLAEQDQAREEKWQNGRAYTTEREALRQRLSGEALDTALSRLREEHFGIAAPTIAKEEAQGFYRFERPRQYGVN